MSYIARGRYFEDFSVGEEFYTASRTITEADIVNFAGISGDYNQLHTNEEFAKTTIHKTRIAHGALSFSISTGLFLQLGIFEGTALAFMEANVKYTKAVKPGDTIRLEAKVADKKASSKGGRGVITLDVSVLNQRDEQVLAQVWSIMVAAKA